MKRGSNSEDVTRLTEREVRILLALAIGKKMTGYEIARQVEVDSSGRLEMGNGTLRPALERLNSFRFIEDNGKSKKGPGVPARSWGLTSLGRVILGGELQSYRKLVNLGDERAA